jgi:biotin/lipoyl-binding protein
MIDSAQAPSDSSRRPAFAGWLVIALFFGGLGIWGGTAPLNGAVVANGVVKVDGNRKSVQHLDGGIVKELRVKEGDRVKAGDVVIVLDDPQAKTEFEVLSEQYVVLRATEIRLLADEQFVLCRLDPAGRRRARCLAGRSSLSRHADGGDDPDGEPHGVRLYRRASDNLLQAGLPTEIANCGGRTLRIVRPMDRAKGFELRPRPWQASR